MENSFKNLNLKFDEKMLIFSIFFHNMLQMVVSLDLIQSKVIEKTIILSKGVHFLLDNQ